MQKFEFIKAVQTVITLNYLHYINIFDKKEPSSVLDR